MGDEGVDSGGLIPDSFSPHVKESLVKILCSKLPPMYRCVSVFAYVESAACIEKKILYEYLSESADVAEVKNA